MLPGRPASAGVSLDTIRRFSGTIPLLGVCLGHQSIARAFGGKVVAAKRLMHGKTSAITGDGKGVFAPSQRGNAIEHADEVFVEFAYLDYLVHENLGIRGGLVLMPMGLVNEFHEPNVFIGAKRPETEQRIIEHAIAGIGGGRWSAPSRLVEVRLRRQRSGFLSHAILFLVDP